MGRALILLGLTIALIGVLVTFADKVPWRGRFPAAIYVKTDNFSFYFPLTTSSAVSVVFSLLLYLFRRSDLALEHGGADRRIPPAVVSLLRGFAGQILPDHHRHGAVDGGAQPLAAMLRGRAPDADECIFLVEEFAGVAAGYDG